MGKMTLPTAEQAEKLRSVGITPEGIVVQVDNGDYICCMCLKTRDEITVRFARKMVRNYSTGKLKALTEEQEKLLRSSKIDTSKIAIYEDVGVVNEGLGRRIYCRNTENDCEIDVAIVGTMWRENGRS